MQGLPPDLARRLRETLSRCGPFESDRSLRAVFVDARIAPWRDTIPEATSRAARVDALIAALLERWDAHDNLALALFVEVLAENTPSGDGCHGELAALATELRQAKEPGEDLSPVPPAPGLHEGKYTIHIHGGQVGAIGDGTHVEEGIHFGAVRPTAVDDPAAALIRARRALATLEEQAAGYTTLTIPVNLKLDLEDKRREVAELEGRVASPSLPPDAGGGAYVGGSVNTGGGDFVGRDQAKMGGVGFELEHLRLDAAVPEEVYIERSFDLAVSVRQLNSPQLEEQGLLRVGSGALQVAWLPANGIEYIRLRIEISSPECEIEGQSSQPFRLYRGQDSPVFCFHLTPKTLGEIGIIIKVYQEDDWLGSARVLTLAHDRIVGEAKIKITSHEFPVQAEEDNIWTTSVLRAHLQRLDVVEIESLCLDHFPEVYDKFGRGMRRDELLNLLLDHCRRHPEDAVRLAELL